MDGVHSNHFKYCTDLFRELISEVYTSFSKHTHMPKKLIEGIISPTLKDRYGDVNSSSNYRPTMISSFNEIVRILHFK